MGTSNMGLMTQEKKWVRSQKLTLHPGWRDQFCPVCGAGPFVIATKHVTTYHNMTREEAHRRFGPLISEARSRGLADNFRYGETRSNAVMKKKRLSPIRHRQWALLVAEEQQKSGFDLVPRLAKRWRISYAAAWNRLRILRRDGYTIPSVKVRADTCKRGHPFTPENTIAVGDTGWRRCRTCYRVNRREQARRRYAENPERAREIARRYYWRHRESPEEKDIRGS